MQICLNRISDASTTPRRSMPSARVELGRQVGHRLLIERRLLARQLAEGLDLGLVGQVGDDGLVGLEPAQDVRPHQRAQRCVRIVRLRREAFRERRERLRRIPSRPGLMKSKIDQRSPRRFSTGVPRERDARLRIELLGRPGLLGAGVLDRLRLVQNGEAPRRVRATRARAAAIRSW